MVELINNEINTSNFYFRLNIYQLHFIDLFNSFREYIYDNTSTINYKPSFDYIKEIEMNIDDSIRKDTQIISNFIILNMLKYDIVIGLINNDICSYYITDYFESIEECQNEFFDIKYGFEIMATSFIKKIHQAKNVVKYYLRTKNVVGNLTEYDKEKWISMGNKFLEQEGDKPTIFRLDLFNVKELHSDFNLMFISIFLPYLQENRRGFLDKIKIEGKEKLFINLFIFYLMVLLIILFVYWVPKVNFINNYIYRTKKYY
jgi:hypothetical protein